MATGKFASAGGWLAVVAALAMVTACGSVATGNRTNVAGPATAAGSPAAGQESPGARTAASVTAAGDGLKCPADSSAAARAAGAAGVPAAPAGLIRRGAAAAVICQYYAGPAAKAAGELTRIPLGAAAADGLAALVDDGTQVASPPSCDGGPLSQFVTFAYQSGPAITAAFASCQGSSGVVTAGGRAAVVTDPFASDLFSYTGLRAPGPPAPGATSIPDVTGLSPAAAAAVARRHGDSLSVDGAALDKSVPFGTVIFQTPPVTAATGPGGTGIGVIIAVLPAPACTPAQLALTYRGGEPGAGSDFGSIVFRDTGRVPCTLTGTVSVTGLNAAGAPVTATVSSRFAGPGVLSPDAAASPEHGQPVPGELRYQWLLAAEYRDDPVSGGMCTPDWVVSASWRVVLPGGGSVTIPNRDPADPARLVPSGGLVTCRGHLDTVGQPSYLTS